MPANTYIASVLAITDNELTPIFVEPNIDSYNLDSSKIVNWLNDDGTKMNEVGGRFVVSFGEE